MEIAEKRDACMEIAEKYECMEIAEKYEGGWLLDGI